MLCSTGEKLIFFFFLRKQLRQGRILVPETWSDIIRTPKLDPEFLGNQSKNRIIIFYTVLVL